MGESSGPPTQMRNHQRTGPYGRGSVLDDLPGSVRQRLGGDVAPMSSAAAGQPAAASTPAQAASTSARLVSNNAPTPSIVAAPQVAALAANHPTPTESRPGVDNANALSTAVQELSLDEPMRHAAARADPPNSASDVAMATSSPAQSSGAPVARIRHYCPIVGCAAADSQRHPGWTSQQALRVERQWVKC